MSRFTLVLGLAVLLVAGCGSGGADTTTTAARGSSTSISSPTGGATPVEAVSMWLDALTIERFTVADDMVIEQQFVLIVAVESFSIDVYRDLVATGVAPAVSRNFWGSFVAGLRGFTGAAIAEVSVEGERRFAAYDIEFAEVGLVAPLGEASVVARLESDGRWYVDLLATFGSGFSPLFNSWLERLPAEATDPREALQAQRSSLRLARDRLQSGADTEVVAELDRLLAAIG